MSDTPVNPPRDDVYDRERHTELLASLPQHLRHEMQHSERIFATINKVERQMQAGFAQINTRLHNIEARAKNEDAFVRRADYIPLLMADGTAIANFPLNAEAVEELDTQTIYALLTHLGADFQGRTLPKKKNLFLREIGIKVIYTG